jgi:hypothetical protein
MRLSFVHACAAGIRGQSFPAAKIVVMADLGKLLLVLGGIIIVIGAVLLVGGRYNLPIGRLPGDFIVRGKHSVFYFPLSTCIFLSILLSLILWVLGRIHR